MADNLALKLLVAGIIGAVVGAAASERHLFPAGQVYGGFNRPPYGPRPAIDPMYGSGSYDEGLPDEGPRVVWERRPDDDWPDWPPPRYRAPRPHHPVRRTAWCWKEDDEWNFGHYVRCPDGRHHPRSD